MDIWGIRASKVIRDVRDSGPNRVRFMIYGDKNKFATLKAL
jgi:hypothetical protein